MVERLDEYLPGFHIVVAVPEITRKSSGETNGSLSDRYLDGEKGIVEKMKLKAKLTQDAKKAIVDGENRSLYRIINKNNDIMRDFGFCIRRK